MLNERYVAELNKELARGVNIGAVMPLNYGDQKSSLCVRGVRAHGKLVVSDRQFQTPAVGTLVQVVRFTGVTHPTERCKGTAFAEVRPLETNELTPTLFDWRKQDRLLRADREDMRWEQIDAEILSVDLDPDVFVKQPSIEVRFRYTGVWRDHHDEFTALFPAGMEGAWCQPERRPLFAPTWAYENWTTPESGAVELSRHPGVIDDRPQHEWPLRIHSIRFDDWHSEEANLEFLIGAPCRTTPAILRELENGFLR